MRISPNARNHDQEGPDSRRREAQRGVTLFELLITLAIVAMMAGMAGVAVNQMIPSLKFRSAVNMIENDLKTARLKARTGGTEIAVLFETHGYEIADLGIHRSFDTNMELVWQGADPLTFDLQPDGAGGTLMVRRRRQQQELSIDPLTQQISTVR